MIQRFTSQSACVWASRLYNEALGMESLLAARYARGCGGCLLKSAGAGKQSPKRTAQKSPLSEWRFLSRFAAYCLVKQRGKPGTSGLVPDHIAPAGLSAGEIEVHRAL